MIQIYLAIKRLLPAFVVPGILCLLNLPAFSQYGEAYDDESIDGPGVILYKHSEFRGKRIFIRAGRNISNLRRLGWNDKISSIELVQGATIRVFQHSGYRGNSTWIKRDVPDLDEYYRNIRGDWNDRISSIKVLASRYRNRYTDDYEGGGQRGAYCILWKHSNSRGPSFEAHFGGVRKIGSKWNDEISSIWIRRGYRLILFEDKYYRGRRLVLIGKGSGGSHYNLKSFGFNDKLSSYRLERMGRSDYKRYYKKRYRRRRY